MNKIVYIAAALLCFSCNDDNNAANPGGASGSVTTVTSVKSDLTVNLSTDKACYKPGETITFRADAMPADTKVRYRHQSVTVGEESVAEATWTWTAPAEDYKGYLAELYRKEGESEVIIGTIAVDVSSDWTRFPRYGFVATFDESKTEEKIKEEMDYLNRHHINGVQFQDWHNKHHWPLGGTRDQLEDIYMDVANRTVSTQVLKDYISTQHSYGMKAMFYNLCFGALNDAPADGVKEEWYLFKDRTHSGKDSHDLPGSWKSNIYLLDPGNVEWQAYLAQRNDDVYANFDFDGFQIDQLGRRGLRYDYNGNPVPLQDGYASFINAMKEKHPQKDLVMNAVSRYGAKQIAGTGKVGFFYNEVWGDEADFEDLGNIVYENQAYDAHLKTVFAAYMNYNRADNKGEFNTPGVLLTDAVMFALGGSHLELGGDHMLCKEYFPNDNLTMSAELKQAMVHYYDFLTAYQNLLRDGGTENKVDMKSPDGSMKLAAWPPKQGSVTTYAKQVGGKQVVHLLNFSQATSLSWRDLDGTMPEPQLISGAQLQMTIPAQVNKLWVASPDMHGGGLQELPFTQENGVLTFTLPALKYWAMIVAE